MDKIRYRWSEEFQVWVRMTEVADPERFPYWLTPREST